MWNRSRQGIQLTKQRLRDKLLAEPTSRSYFTEALLSIGEKKKKRRTTRGQRENQRGGARKNNGKCFRQTARIYGWTILSRFSGALVLSFLQCTQLRVCCVRPASYILSRICANKTVQRSRDSCVHQTVDTMNYRCTLNIVLAGSADRSPPFFHPISSSTYTAFRIPNWKNIGRLRDFW